MHAIFVRCIVFDCDRAGARVLLPRLLLTFSCTQACARSYTEPLCLSVVCDQILEEGHFPKQYLLQNLSIGDWTSQQVARWLVGIHLEHHIPEFTAQNVDGERLLQLETPELKVTCMPQSSQESPLTFVF